jgi:UDP-N-acetylmuramoylalanine--D-glutamate ligase
LDNLRRIERLAVKGGKYMELSGKRIAVVGLAANNTPLIKYLVSSGSFVTALDRKTPSELGDYLRQLRDLPIEYHLGSDYLKYLYGHDEVFLSPGIPRNLPEIQAAIKAGVSFSSEMELFFSVSPGPIIGVTGSSGKTTTTTIIGLIMERCGSARVGGNIGRPPISFLSELTEETQVVLELSSFQLQSMTNSPNIALVTNVTPNHLDVHVDMEEYIEAKTQILRHQNPQDYAVLNLDNEITRKMAGTTPGRVYFFSRTEKLLEGAFFWRGELILRLNNEEEIICGRDEMPLPGDHNVENVLAAALTCRLAGAPIRVIQDVVTKFTGVEHRLELVREYKGVKYYNDSISTTPDRAMAGLAAIPAPILLIVGGYDKHLPFHDFAALAVERCKAVILIGATAPIIREALEMAEEKTGRVIEKINAGSLHEAIVKSRDAASPGDVVLLSPACASYDMFRNFEERGKLFKEIVNGLDREEA